MERVTNETENIKFVPIGTELKPKNPCKMNDGSGEALIMGKVYKVLGHSENTQEIFIKTELFENHFFSVDYKHKSYWGNFFYLNP